MNHALLKSVIYDQHEFIRDFQIVPRNYEFEENGNYVLVGLRRAGKSTLLNQLADLFVERHAFDQFRGAPPVLRGDGLRPGGIQHEGRQYGKDAIFHR